jgi:hypothetical protein
VLAGVEEFDNTRDSETGYQGFRGVCRESGAIQEAAQHADHPL